MEKEKLKTIENRFIQRINFSNESAFQEEVKKQQQEFSKQYDGCKIEKQDSKPGVLITVRELPEMAERREL